MAIANPAVPDLLDHLTTAVLGLDADLRVRLINAAAEQLLAASRRKAMGEPVSSLMQLPESVHDRLHETIKNGQTYAGRQINLTVPGHEPVLVDCSVSPCSPGSHGSVLVIEMATVDWPLRIARDEAMVIQQEHARSLLRGLAHEIKNPLGGLRGAAQLLEKQLPSAELQDYTSIIIQEADRLQGLIDRMLGPVTRPQHERVNIHEILEHVRKISRVGAPRQALLRFDYDPSIPEFLSDRDRLVQVFLNILGNALHAIGDRGCIMLRSRVASSLTIGSIRHPLVAVIEVQDDGPGVPEALRDQIFFPMVTGTDHGTGLGLSIAQSMINQLGGLIEYRSEPGHTVFSVLIPLEQA